MRTGRNRELWLVVAGAVSLVLVGCSSGRGDHEPDDVVPVRISPVRAEIADAPSDASAWLLFDRDTRAGWSPAAVETDRSLPGLSRSLPRSAELTSYGSLQVSPPPGLSGLSPVRVSPSTR